MTAYARPEAGPSRDYHFPDFDQHVLANGMSIIVASVRKLPVVTVLAIVNAGATSDPEGREGLAQLTAEALREGTVRMDGLHLTEEFEKLGTSLESGADWDSTVMGMTVLKDRLDDAFALFAEVLTSPAFPNRDIERLRSERLADRLQVLSEPRGLADESFERFIYAPGSRYSKPLSGVTRSVSAITREDVAGFYQENYSPNAVTLIVAGDTGSEDVMNLVETHLGSWQRERRATLTRVDERARTSRSVELIAKTDAPQSEVRIGHAGVARTHPDYFSIVVMNAVLGGLFSSRINLNLREVHGYTYGASSHFDWRRDAGPFVISTAVQSEVTGEAIRETIGEIDRMRTEEIAEDELSLATSYLAGVFPIRYETTAAIASALGTMVIFGLPSNYYDTYRDRIRAVSTTDVLSAAVKHVSPDEIQILVVGNPAIIKEPMELLGFGSPVVREAGESC